MRLFNIILFVIYKILYDDIFHAKKKKEKKRNYLSIEKCTFIYITYVSYEEYYRKNVL